MILLLLPALAALMGRGRSVGRSATLTPVNHPIPTTQQSHHGGGEQAQLEDAPEMRIRLFDDGLLLQHHPQHRR
jgi:hypothetical protein